MDQIKKTHNQRVTIKDIASQAGVSIGTVDRVLHNRGEVNPETRNRIMAIVDELGYTPNLIAKSLALKKNFSIAVVIPGYDEYNPYWKKPVDGFLKAADELNDFSTKISIFNYDLGNETSFIAEFEKAISASPDGIILAPHFHKVAAKLVRKCRTLKIPYIFMDNNLENEPCLAYFGQNAFQSGKVAAKLMHYSLPENSTVVILNPAPNKAITHHMQRREEGFTEYFLHEGSGQHITVLSVAIDLSAKQEPHNTLRQVFSKNPGIAGVFVTNSRVHKVAEYFSTVDKGSVMLTGYDLVDDSLRYLEKGIIDILICQKPEDQGYRSAMAMFNYLLHNKPVEKINYSPIDIIIPENVRYYMKE